ncbi:MAG: RNA polymerase sigma factor [Rhodobacteraceae bacterium]|nr:RNA polymerase sigma factor [Paracoccaceae bacterium]
MQTSDEDLAGLAQNGDADAFSLLLTRHYDLIFRLAFRCLGRRDAAEDLAQDICAALPAKIIGFRGEARFTTWLYRVVANAATDRLRQQRSRQKAGFAWGETEQLRRESATEKQAELIWLEQAMQRLTPELRQTVALVLGDDLSHAEAAKILDLSEGTISWRMSKVRETLRRIAKEEEAIR